MKRREPAWRMFASEYNDATVEIKGSAEEKIPSYVITPLGAKVNRLFIIGVLTDVEHISEGGDMVRAHVSDPTGVFTLYSGQYQQEATNSLSQIEVPAFVAVVGKARTYEPEPGTVFVSVRPELVHEVKADMRDQWIVETCRQTRERIAALIEARKMNPANAYDLRKLGYSKDLSEGVITAMKQYKDIDVHKYVTILQEALQYFSSEVSEKEKTVEHNKKLIKPKTPIDETNATPTEPEETPKVVKKGKKGKKEEKPKDQEPAVKPASDPDDVEHAVLVIIKEIEGENGAAWDDIVKRCEKTGLDEAAVEEALTSLMDKGFIFEPVLGTIKTT